MTKSSRKQLEGDDGLAAQTESWRSSHVSSLYLLWLNVAKLCLGRPSSSARFM